MRPARSSTRGFTIVELLVATAITVVIVVMLGMMFGSLAGTTSRANQRIDAFRDARAALQMMARDFSNLTPTQWQPDPFTTPPPTVTPVALTRASAFFALEDIYKDPASGNHQLYGLIAAKNSGRGDVCAVGYYCRWDEEHNAYELRRHFRDSDATHGALMGSGSYASTAMLYSPDAVNTKYAMLKDDLLAAYVWKLRVTLYDHTGTEIKTFPYVCDSAANSPVAPPAAIEISFNAMSSNAARTVMSTGSQAGAWMNENDGSYKRLIAPNAYPFRTRINLH